MVIRNYPTLQISLGIKQNRSYLIFVTSLATIQLFNLILRPADAPFESIDLFAKVCKKNYLRV